ncbi:MAG: hypothetical protein DRO87_11985 [Candidatus Thorarchaeota archaeon]|nr:MAG: hypothetical protein DRO87_11985 [Candidatus Thorarchaeota archaeon]
MIYVALDYSEKILDIVMARSYELAQVYWQGKGVIAHHAREIKPSDLENHITGVIPIASTREVHAHEIKHGAVLRVLTKP